MKHQAKAQKYLEKIAKKLNFPDFAAPKDDIDNDDNAVNQRYQDNAVNQRYQQTSYNQSSYDYRQRR